MKVHFSGEPDRFARMRALFPTQNTLRVIHAEAKPSKVTLFYDAKGQWIGRGIWQKFRRTA
jgi:hypothetical protein